MIQLLMRKKASEKYSVVPMLTNLGISFLKENLLPLYLKPRLKKKNIAPW